MTVSNNNSSHHDQLASILKSRNNNGTNANVVANNSAATSTQFGTNAPPNYTATTATTTTNNVSKPPIKQRKPQLEPNYPKCKALYTYSASEPDELSFNEGDIIYIVKEGEILCDTKITINYHKIFNYTNKT